MSDDSVTLKDLADKAANADLKPLLDAIGFDGCVAVQAEQSIAEAEWLLRLADEHPFIRGVVGWVAP